MIECNSTHRNACFHIQRCNLGDVKVFRSLCIMQPDLVDFGVARRHPIPFNCIYFGKQIDAL